MKKLFALALLYCQLPNANCQLNYWQQEVHYTIDVSLNDKENTLDGFEKIEYINNSPDTLKFIWFHLWPNAYKNDRTAFSDQLLENGNTKFYFSDREQRGYINRLDFRVNNVTARMEDHPQYIDIVKLILPSPLPPAQKIIITTPFHEKLPFNFSRGGYDGQSYQVTQWYPKPAVYDKKGWHPMPYLDQGEFYSEFGSFDVNISVPKNYVVAATGELQNEDEKQWMNSRKNYEWEPIKNKEKIKGGGYKTTVQLFPESSSQSKTLHYKQDNVHDFAWFADKRFIVDHDSCQLASGRIIEVYAYYTPEEKEKWQHAVRFGKDAVLHYSNLVGEYPYNIVSVVQGPKSFGGGMEYPTITVISPGENLEELDNTMAHEIGHNWFYGILGSNERDYPWMDEGINTYYDFKYHFLKYKRYSKLERIGFETKAVTKTDQPINLSSEKYSEINYNVVVYYKTGEWLRYLESEVGTGSFDRAMQEYYRRWHFKHPQPEDFQKTLEESTGENLDSTFSYINKPGLLPNQKRKGTTGIFGIMGDVFMNGPDITYKNQILFAPSFGTNSYDKFMVGGLLTNYRLPPSGFQFLAAPMYSTGAKKLVGLGKISYSSYSYHGLIHKTELFLNASKFSYDEFEKIDGKKIRFSFLKIVPGVKLTMREKDPRSTKQTYIQWKTFFINEETYGTIKYDTTGTPPNISINQRVQTKTVDRYLNQLRLVSENYRALYPYQGELKIEQSDDFVRGAFTGNYFFNYPKAGGFNVRLFAGKFIYLGSKTFTKQFATDRYHLNMAGANGYEDYTYSDYFLGRNKFEGLPSQQMMMRDGAFKIRTDLLAEKVGKTDDWLATANFTTTIPSNINPLSLLPLKIPLKIFVDVGTYAEAWKQGANTDRFLYDGGLYIPLFKELVNIYVPLIYSDVYKTYIQSTFLKKERFWKRISFSIDISNFNIRKYFRYAVF